MVILLGGLAGKLVIDLLPPTWAGSAGLVAVVLVGFAGLGWLAVECRWGAREIGLLGAAAIIGGTLVGFLDPPPEGVAVATKYAQNLVLLALAVERRLGARPCSWAQSPSRAILRRTARRPGQRPDG